MREQWLSWQACVLGAALALAACSADAVESSAQAARVEQATQSPAAPGGIVRSGDSFATMADQYQPRAGPYSATGASAWVAPAPAPAFVFSGPLPAAAPPPPPLAAVANREPEPAAPPAAVVRPEAAQPDPPGPAAAAPNRAVRTAGLALFNNYACGACHALADAGAAGSIGPSLDRNPRLTKAFAVDVISNGRGAMPSFAGQMSPEEIDQLAEYIVQFARK
jgi:mono/diheme cytochrome c family protein